MNFAAAAEEMAARLSVSAANDFLACAQLRVGHREQLQSTRVLGKVTWNAAGRKRGLQLVAV